MSGSWLDRPGKRLDGGVRLPHPDGGVWIEPMSSISAHKRLLEVRRNPRAAQPDLRGKRARAEEPDEYRTCFERDRDRILHDTSFRRLAGKTQVALLVRNDHVRTRLTHTLEVAQVARAIARTLGLDEALTEAIAYGHDVGHCFGGHAGEDALDEIAPDGFDHATAGAKLLLERVNLCEETLDGVRNHSWRRPTPRSAEGAVVSLADRIAYTCHDWADGLVAGLVSERDLPGMVRHRLGTTQSAQIDALVRDVVDVAATTGWIGLSEPVAQALDEFREAAWQRIYTSPVALVQATAIHDLAQGLVRCYTGKPWLMGEEYAVLTPGSEAALRAAVRYVAGMTDRFALAQGEEHLGFDRERIPVLA